MIALVTMVLAAVLFGAAGWGGTLVAELLCEGRARFDDGPAPVAFAASGSRLQRKANRPRGSRSSFS